MGSAWPVTSDRAGGRSTSQAANKQIMFPSFLPRWHTTAITKDYRFNRFKFFVHSP
jgi:hypothetical protein